MIAPSWRALAMTDREVCGSWWGTDQRTLSRVLADQLHAELRRLRLGAPGGPPPWSWTDATRLDELGPAAIDSLDLLSLSAATAELLPEGSLGPGLMQARCFGAWCDAVAGSVRRPPRHVTFRSSGSIGEPRRTTHALPCLETEAKALASLIGNGRRRVLSAIPAHHAYGFIHSVLLPRHLGNLPIVELRGHTPADLATLLRPGDLVLGHPAFWDAALRGMSGSLPVDAVGVTSSAPCPAETAIGLRQAGLARLLQVYGASETAGIGWRDDPAQPYKLLSGWRRDGDGLRRGEQPVEAPDLLSWEQDDRFRVVGRRDGAVQVGGVNVIPGQVSVALMRHPAVADIAVRPMRLEEGSRLKAFVVPAAGAPASDELRAELHHFATATLTSAERPGAYSFGPALPRTELGKLTDWSAAS
jgi:long-chain acyl-CoA synthetase